MTAARARQALASVGDDGAAALLPASDAAERAMALVPALSFLVRQAHQDGLDVVSDIVAKALNDILQWIEQDKHHDLYRSQGHH